MIRVDGYYRNVRQPNIFQPMRTVLTRRAPRAHRSDRLTQRRQTRPYFVSSTAGTGRDSGFLRMLRSRRVLQKSSAAELSSDGLLRYIFNETPLRGFRNVRDNVLVVESSGDTQLTRPAPPSTTCPAQHTRDLCKTERSTPFRNHASSWAASLAT